jgi:TrmH family RNA methyltransferase
VVEAPEKPGNIGALLRTAAAANWEAVIIANPKTDLYHPQIIRNSMGGVFSIPIAADDSEKVISFLEKNNFNITAAALHNEAKHYKRVKYQRPLALVFGTEDKGLDPIWFKKVQQIVKIPVKFPIDSLNLSVSAGILMYHCGEQ